MKTNRSTTNLIFAIASLAALALACQFATGGNESATQEAADLAATESSLQGTQAALAAPTQTPQPTTAPTRTPQPTREPFFTEEFEQDLDDWSYFSFGDGEADYYLENGSLVFDMQEESTFSYLIYDGQEYTDVRLDAEVQNLGANKNWVSLVCRESDRGWYEFNIGNDGYYVIYYYDATSDDFRELYSGGSSAIHTGKKSNQYTAICEGDRLSLLINGVETRTVTHEALSEGHIGVSTSSYDIVPVLLEFDWLMISQP